MSRASGGWLALRYYAGDGLLPFSFQVLEDLAGAVDSSLLADSNSMVQECLFHRAEFRQEDISSQLHLCLCRESMA